MPTLKRLRELAVLSRSELAEACGVSRQTIWEWESGRARPTALRQRKLLEALKITPAELLDALEETRKEKEKEDQNERPAA